MRTDKKQQLVIYMSIFSLMWMDLSHIKSNNMLCQGINVYLKINLEDEPVIFGKQNPRT